MMADGDSPTGFQGSVIPYLAVADGAAALAFYAEAFGAVETFRIEDGGKIGHAEFRIFGAVFYLSDEWPEMKVKSPATLGGYSVSLALTVPDADQFVQRVAACGARVERPVAEGPQEGTRAAWVIDPFGHRWHISSAAPRIRASE
jgi:PhnB protein